jgi:MerR family transcriptional regulator, redox-sensitive transcriptional activator SoxR
MDTEELLPGELAARAGVAVSALHFYERQGLVTSRRTSGNQRRYSRDTLRRVAFIRMSHTLGIPLARVREALATLPTDRVPTSRDWARLSAGWRADLDDRILHLERLRDNRSRLHRLRLPEPARLRVVQSRRRARQPGPRTGTALA